MSENKDKKRIIQKKDNNLLFYALIGLVLVLIIIGFSISRLSLWQKDIRDKQRVEIMESVVSEIEKLKSENENYPEAVFFKTDSVLICSTIDCFISEEVVINGSAKGTSDILNKTDRNYTKYAYELTEEAYKIAYCDEEGNIRNFGKAPFGEELNCE